MHCSGWTFVPIAERQDMVFGSRGTRYDVMVCAPSETLKAAGPEGAQRTLWVRGGSLTTPSRRRLAGKGESACLLDHLASRRRRADGAGGNTPPPPARHRTLNVGSGKRVGEAEWMECLSKANP